MSDRAKQKQLVLNALKSGPRTTMQLISLGICCPTRRITELRRDGQQILTSKEKRSGRLVFLYTLMGHSQLENDLVSVHERSEQVLACATCGSGVVRKPKARPLQEGEKPACSNACRAKRWRAEKAQAELFTGVESISTAFQSRGDGA